MDSRWMVSGKAFILAAAVLFAAAAARAAETAPPEKSTAAVTLGGKTILTVQGRLLSLTAEERAQRASERIKRVARNPLLDPAKIEWVDGEITSDIVLDDRILMSVTEADAAAAGLDRRELARQHAELIRAAVLLDRRDYSVKALALGAFFALLCTIALVFAIKLTALGHRRLAAWLEGAGRRRIPTLRIQRVELLPADRIVEILVGLGRFLYVAALVALFYVYLPIVFSFFPWTRGFAEVLFGYVFAPLAAIARAVIGYLPSLFFLLVTFVCVRYFLKVVRIVFQEVRRGRIAFPGFYPEWSEPTYKIVRFFIWAFALVVMFPYLPGSDSPAFKGVSVFLGVLFSLGSSSAIANAVAGVILTYMRPFTAGDRVKIADTVGEVIEKTLLVTRVRTVKNVDVTIPNALTLNSHIVNYSSSAAEHGLVLNTTVTIGYDVPWKKVHELLVAAAKATENVLADPAPFVLQTALGDFSVSYELNAYTDKPSLMVRVYSDLHQNIQDKFNAAGVEIMSPAFTAVRDGNATTVPEENRPKGYQAPRFRLFSKPEPS